MSDCPFPLVDEMWNLNVVRREIAKLFYIVKRMRFFAQFHKNSSFEYDGYSYTCNLNTYQILIMHIAYKEDDDGRRPYASECCKNLYSKLYHNS